MKNLVSSLNSQRWPHLSIFHMLYTSRKLITRYTLQVKTTIWTRDLLSKNNHAILHVTETKETTNIIPSKDASGSQKIQKQLHIFLYCQIARDQERTRGCSNYCKDFQAIVVYVENTVFLRLSLLGQRSNKRQATVFWRKGFLRRPVANTIQES